MKMTSLDHMEFSFYAAIGFILLIISIGAIGYGLYIGIKFLANK
jgi:hypothetical protein